MKRFKYFLMLVILMGSTSVSAYDVEVNGICYNYINDNTELEVTYYSTNVSTTAPYYKGSVVIPESVTILNRTRKVTRIGDYAFRYCGSITAVTIPNSVTSIGSAAFYECGLTSVNIPNSVTSIGSEAFSQCRALKKVIVKDIAAWCGISFSGYYSNPLLYAKHLYSDNDTEITDLVIPDGVMGIVSSAFQECSGLTSVVISNSVTSIGSSAFASCVGLTSVSIGNGVTSIGSDAFRNCSGLTSVVIPNSVTSIGSTAFSNCSGLASVTIGNGVTSIGAQAFSSCSGLTSIDIPNNVTSIGGYAFEKCSGLTSVTIGNGVTSIGGRAFEKCSGLTSITIGNGVTSIGDYAFQYCNGLKKVIVKDIAAWCGVSFNDNYSSNPLYYAKHLYSDEDTEITSLVIPDSVTSIGSLAFYGCNGLTSVTIPNSVTSIGSAAFYGCSELAEIVSLLQEPFEVSHIVSDFIYKNGTLYVPESTIEKYKATDGWKQFVWMEEGVPTGIGHPNSDGCSTREVQRYTLGGQSASESQRGLNIIRMSDGATKKVVIK